MGKIYTSTFETLKKDIISVDIYKTGSTASAAELVLDGNEPVVIEYNQDSVFDTLKTSSCSVGVITDTPMFDLYTGQLSNITIEVKRNNTLIWFGFLSPNVYSMPYDSKNNKLTLEFVCPITAMEDVKFKKFGDNFFATFTSYITQALSKVGASSMTIEGLTEDNIGCMQRNFIDETDDEDDGAMTWQEVLDSIMRYLNKTACCYGGKLCVYDPLASKTAKAISTLGIAGSNGSISLGNLYNKVTVVANNNPLGTTIPNILDSDDHDTTGMMPPGTYEITTEVTKPSEVEKETEEERQYPGVWVLCNAYLKNKKWSYGDSMAIDTGLTLDHFIKIQKYFEYKKSDGVPSSRDWKTVLTLTCDQTSDDGILDLNKTTHYYGDRSEATGLWGWKCYVNLTQKPFFIGKGGMFILSMSYMLSNVETFANSAPFDFTPETYGEALEYSSVNRDATFRDDKFKVMLGIGGKYWNGSSWQSSECTFYIIHRNSKGDTIFGIKKEIDNTVSYQWNLADSRSGYGIPLPDDEVMNGNITFKLWADSRLGGTAQRVNQVVTNGSDQWGNYSGKTYNTSPIMAIHIDGLSLTYTTSDTVEDIYNLKTYDADVTYTNTVDENNIKEADDVEFRVNTYTKKAVSYSYAIKLSNGTYTYVDEGEDMNPEKTCIQRMVNYYSSARMSYEITLNEGSANSISPTEHISASFLGKTFTVGGVTYNLADNSASLTLLEV